MTEGFPSRITTATTTQTTVTPEIRWDPTFIRTPHGIIKCALVVLNLAGFLCIAFSGIFRHSSRGEFFSTISMTGLLFTGAFLLFYLFHICEKFYRIPWLKIEWGFNIIWTIMYLFGAAFVAAYNVESFHAAAFFGFCTMILYGYDAYVKWQALRAGEIAQGSRSISVNQQNTTSLNIIGFICILCSGDLRHASRGEFFSTISMIGFWFTGFMLFFYLFHICEKFYRIPWLKIEWGFDIIWVIMYVFGASFAAAYGVEAYQAAAFFGYCAMVLYGFDAFNKWKAFRAGEIAQGSRTVTVNQQTATSIA